MTASAGAWYRVGTVGVTAGTQTVAGNGTNWQNDLIAIAIGDIFTLDAKTWYEVIAVNSDTSITLDRGFEGATSSTQSYAIVRNTSGTILTRIAGQVAVQFNQKQLFLDELRTWLNSANASETLTDSHGVTQSLKTPAQMVADHDNRLAELDEIHPHPWAMRKVEFEANRKQNNEKFAASGFVHFGKHTPTGENTIKEGLSALPTVSNNLFMGRGDSAAQGASRTQYPVINIAGVVTKFSSNLSSTSIYNSNKVKLPPAEDGTRTYDSATGISVTHATPAIAFASETDTNKVVTDRVDMWGFEAFLREINDDDPFVYANGLIQSQSANIDGVTTVTDNVRPATYFAWYEGDSSSAGKGVNWQTATEAQRTAIASDPENNIYFDDATGKFYQWCIRGRSFAGAGNGDWSDVDSVGNSYLKHSITSGVKLQGHNSEVGPYYSSANSVYSAFATGNTSDNNTNAKNGVFSAFKNGPAINGECFFLVCGTVNRLNKGAYHPSFNPSGANVFWRRDGTASVNSWYQSESKKPSSSLDCFDMSSTSSTSGDVSPFVNSLRGVAATGVSGRSDGRFYDAIYASGQGGVCRDMRYSAWGLTQEDFSNADLAVKSGEYRGGECPSQIAPLFRWVASADGASNTYLPCSKETFEILRPDIFGTDSVIGRSALDFTAQNRDQMIGGQYSVFPINGNNIKAPYTAILINKTQGKSIVFGAGQGYAAYFSGNRVTFYPYSLSVITKDPQNSYNSWILANVAEGDQLELYGQIPYHQSVYGEFTCTEVIGEPVNILQCEDLKNGWVGSWNPKLPAGNQEYSLTRNVISATTLAQRVTTDLGITWSSTTRTLDTTRNSFTASLSSGGLYINQYTTKAHVTENSVNSAVYGGRTGLGTVMATGDTYRGDSKLRSSLIGGLNTTRTWTAKVSGLPITAYNNVDPTINASGFGVTHQSLPKLTPATSAVKALNYNVVENQQGFINYAYTELTYDATAGDWGDDSKIHIADNQTTMLDTNGNTVKVGTARIVEPLGWIKNDK